LEKKGKASRLRKKGQKIFCPYNAVPGPASLFYAGTGKQGKIGCRLLGKAIKTRGQRSEVGYQGKAASDLSIRRMLWTRDIAHALSFV